MLDLRASEEVESRLLLLLNPLSNDPMVVLLVVCMGLLFRGNVAGGAESSVCLFVCVSV